MKKKKLKAYIKELETHIVAATPPKTEEKESLFQEYFNLEEARSDLEFIRKGAAKINTVRDLEERLEFVKKYGFDPAELAKGA